VAELVRRGHRVSLVVKPTTDLWRLAGVASETIEIQTGDLSRAGDALRVVEATGPECIVHCATRGAYPGQSGLLDIVEANVVGFARLLEAAAVSGCPQVINTGSSSEYGAAGAGPSEADAAQPNSIYAASKAWCSAVAQRSIEDVGVVVTTLRLYSVYGYFEEPSRLMARVCAYGLLGRYPPMARPDIVRDYVWIEDVIRAYLAVLEGEAPAASELFNVGSGEETRLDEVMAAAGRVFGLTGAPAWGDYPERRWETERWFANRDKISRRHGWAPTVGIDDGLRRMGSWLEGRPTLRDRYTAACELEASGG